MLLSLIPLLALAAPDVATEPLELDLHQTTGARFHRDARASLFFDGAVFGEIAAAIHQARTSVNIVLYIWRPGEPSNLLIQALQQKTQAGVACRVLVDPVGSTPEFQQKVMPGLVSAGCDVRLFRPLTRVQGLQGSRLARNHRKMVIVDGVLAFTGGFGFSQEWLGGRDGAHEWRDTAIRVEGEVVDGMQVAFAQDWNEVDGPLLPASDFPQRTGPGSTPSAFVPSTGSLGPTNADRLSRLTFGAAQKRLWIANAYFVPSEALLTLLEKNASAGVDVRVLVPNDLDDSQVALDGQRLLYERLLRHGVRIWEYQPAMMHAKTTLIDGRWIVVGSANLDPLSLNLLEEGCVVVDSEPLNAQLASRFEQDLQSAQEIKLGAREIPGFWKRLRHRFFPGKPSDSD